MTEQQPRAGDAELIEKARIVCDSAPSHMRATYGLIERLADRLEELAKPETWRAVDEPPPILERVFVRVGPPALRALAHVDGKKSGAAEFYRTDASRVEIGYHTRGYSCGWADNEGRRLEDVTGWQPIRRPEP